MLTNYVLDALEEVNGFVKRFGQFDGITKFKAVTNLMQTRDFENVRKMKKVDDDFTSRLAFASKLIDDAMNGIYPKNIA